MNVIGRRIGWPGPKLMMITIIIISIWCSFDGSFIRHYDYTFMARRFMNIVPQLSYSTRAYVCRRLKTSQRCLSVYYLSIYGLAKSQQKQRFDLIGARPGGIHPQAQAIRNAKSNVNYCFLSIMKLFVLLGRRGDEGGWGR